MITYGSYPPLQKVKAVVILQKHMTTKGHGQFGWVTFKHLLKK